MYGKMAINNITSNKKDYLPFVGSMSFLVAANLVMQLILHNPGMNELPGAAAVYLLFRYGSYVIILFSFIFSLYINQFLLKKQMKMYGLYHILGLDKRELYRMICWKLLINYLIVLGSGLFMGTVFSKVSFLFLKKVAHLGEAFTYSVDVAIYGIVALLFFIIFLCLLLLTSLKVSRLQPLSLMRQSEEGEKEPKMKWISGLLGIGLLMIGYTIAVTVSSPIEAIFNFFIAVCLVIVATYFIFSSTSILFLKMLKNNKKYYYQPNHFISIANMIFKMKQHAYGLATISVLSTMVLVTLVTTLNLFLGISNVVDHRNPYDISIDVTKDGSNVLDEATKLAKQEKISIVQSGEYAISSGFYMTQKHYQFNFVIEEYKLIENQKYTMVYFMTQQQYEKIAHESMNLTENQVWLYTMDKQYNEDKLELLNHTFDIVHQPKQLAIQLSDNIVINTMLIILPNEQWLNEIYALQPAGVYQTGTVANEIVYLDASSEEQLAYSMKLKTNLTNEREDLFLFKSKSMDKNETDGFIGGFLFLGIIFSIIFILATGLVMYYKQLSEGSQDKQRYDIMQQIGMTKSEVKRTIQSQTVLVFLFPIVLAAINVSFALPMISQMLLTFGLSNHQLTTLVVVMVVSVFILIYCMMYRMTSKEYYKIVKRG